MDDLNPVRPRSATPWAFALIAVMMAGLWLYGSRHQFIPCDVDCGETFVAAQQVTNFRLSGFSYGLLQDHATSTRPAAHPYLYTHNVSIPALLFPLLDGLGLKPLWSKQLLTLFVYGAGLLYIFRVGHYLTQSRVCAFALLLFFCSDFLGTFSFGLNALRSWHWLALFGLLFHAGRLAIERHRHPWRDHFALAVFALLAFGIGYDFWIIGLLITVLSLLIYPPEGEKRRVPLGNLAWVGLVFFLPLVLRQIQVAAVLGAEFWWKDLIYSAGIKVPFLAGIISLPPIAEIDSYYEAFNVVRAPASPPASWGEIGRTFSDMVVQILVPNFGLVSMSICALVSLMALVALPWHVWICRQRVATPLLDAVRMVPVSLRYFWREAAQIGGGAWILLGRSVARAMIRGLRLIPALLPALLPLTVAALIEPMLAGTRRQAPAGFYIGVFFAVSLATLPRMRRIGSETASGGAPIASGLALGIPFLIAGTVAALMNDRPARFVPAALLAVLPPLSLYIGRRPIGASAVAALDRFRRLANEALAPPIAIAIAGAAAVLAYSHGFGLRPTPLVHLLVACLVLALPGALHLLPAPDDRLEQEPPDLSFSLAPPVPPSPLELPMEPAWRAARLLIVLFISVAVGLLVFAPLSLHIYLKHGFPLLSAVVWLAKAMLFAAIAAWFRRAFVDRRPGRWFAFAAMALLIADHAIVQARNIRSAEPIDNSWIPNVATDGASSYAVTWAAESVAGITDGWVAGMLPGTDVQIERRLKRGAPPFEFSDYFLFGQRDRASVGDAYLRPDRLLYLVTDRQDQFDRPEPRCREDYLMEALDSALPHEASAPGSVLFWFPHGDHAPPGGSVAIGGTVQIDRRDLDRIELRSANGSRARLPYNCIYHTFVGVHRIPDEARKDFDVVEVWATYRDGREFRLGALNLTIDPGAPRRSAAELQHWSRRNQRSPAEFIADNPELPLIARGQGYALFDMRAVYDAR